MATMKELVYTAKELAGGAHRELRGVVRRWPAGRDAEYKIEEAAVALEAAASMLRRYQKAMKD